MSIIHNPIIPGMAPDPSIIRVGTDYYIATSTFHWNPAIQIFHSTNLANWNLLTQVLKHNEVDLRGTNTPAGIWAPHLSFDEKTNKYWLAYSHMQNMAGREFNADSFAMWADDIKGPWSKPIYLTSIGFDPSLFHDKDGRHYLSILEWESRVGYQAPGHIVIVEVDLNNGNIIGDWHSVTTGFTTRGCVEAPQLYRHNDYYYLMLASGGTGYAHGIEMGRSKNIFGPYEPNPTNEPILTSSPHHLFSLGDPDAGHFEMYNPLSQIQKAGHGSLVQTPEDEWYIAHLMSRPLPNTKLNPLGRETGLQKMMWNSQGWLTMADGSNLAKDTVEGPKGVQTVQQKPDDSDIQDEFHETTFDNHFMTPYRPQDSSWVNTTESPNHLRIHGGNSFFSQVNPSIMATRAASLNYTVQTSIEFNPEHFSQSAGLGLYYDANNWLYARICLSDKEDSRVLRILQAKLGERHDYKFDEVPITEGALQLKFTYHSGNVTFQSRSTNSDSWSTIRNAFNVAYLSDEGVNGEPGEIGGFTGLFNFIGAIDAFQHKSFADFDYYKVSNFDNNSAEVTNEQTDK